MKTLVLFFLMYSFQVVSQEDTTVYQYVDEEAQFPGGTAAMMAWIQKNLIAEENDFLLNVGKIYIEFNVEKDGSLTNIKDRSGNLSNTKFLELFKNSPKWIPAKLNGKVVRSIYKFPLYICFD